MGGGRISGTARKPAHSDKKPDKKNNPEDVFSQTSPRLHDEYSGHVRTPCQQSGFPGFHSIHTPRPGFRGDFSIRTRLPARSPLISQADPKSARHRPRIRGRNPSDLAPAASVSARAGRAAPSVIRNRPRKSQPPAAKISPCSGLPPGTTDISERFRSVTAFTDFPSPLEENGSRGGSDNGQNPSRIQGICDKNCDQGNDGNRNGASQG